MRQICYNCFQALETPEDVCPYCGFDHAENMAKFPVALPMGTLLHSRYVTGRVLGQGGFGITYLAFDQELDARVAIKEYMPSEIANRDGTAVSIIADTMAESFLYGEERFRDEAKTLAKFIGNPNIAGVSSYFDENGTSYFVMDYIEGVSFKSYIADAGGKISVDEALTVMIPVLRALTAVHEEGFVHRDVTPDNIYISKDGNVKLLDFGSARYSIGDKSKSLDVILKVGYAPKEQYIRRGRQGPFTDVYSCGACFYALLTGFLPPESLERMDQDTLVPVSQSGVEIPPWLDNAILKALAVQPEDRFQSAAEFLNAIENQIVVELPVAGGAEAQKKKRLPLIIGGVAAMLAVALGLGIFAGRGGNSASGEVSGGSDGVVSGGVVGMVETLTEQVKRGVPIEVDGEEFYSDATTLDLSNHNLSDLSQLAGFERVKELKLTLSPSCEDLSPLSSLTTLEKLELTAEATYFDDLSVLAPLTNLKSIDLRVGDIRNLTGLENLSNLEELDASSPNGLSFPNLEPLAHLTELKTLGLRMMSQGYNALDLTPLAGCTQITKLVLDHRVLDLEPLRGMTHMRTLELKNGYMNSYGDENLFKSLEPLSGMRELTTIQLTNGNLKSLDGLENAENLTTLSMQSFWGDISALAGLSNLQSVSFFFNVTGQERDYANDPALAHVPSITINGEVVKG